MNTDENTTTVTPEVPPQPLTLQWGLQPPPDATIAWGARAIYKLSTHESRFFDNGKRRKTPKSVTTASIDLPYDRHEMIGGTDTERKLLAKWLDKAALPALRKRCVEEYLTGDSEDTIEIEGACYALKASPRASYGYLYIVAYKVTP